MTEASITRSLAGVKTAAVLGRDFGSGAGMKDAEIMEARWN